MKNTIQYYDGIDFKYEKNNSFYDIKTKKEKGKIEKKDTKEKEYSKSNLFILKNKVLQCKSCNLHIGKKNYVFGKGNENADIMFIGEGPGEVEDNTGEPFVGPAGKLLQSIIEKGMKLKKEEVYLSNVVRCRPPNNRNPLDIEVSSCINFLYEEIELINPKIIVTLGGVALRSLLPHYNGITKHRGKILNLILKNGKTFKLIPTFHPSYLLRGSDKDKLIKKRQVWEDIKKVMDYLGLPY